MDDLLLTVILIIVVILLLLVVALAYCTYKRRNEKDSTDTLLERLEMQLRAETV
jgi:heme/copper-type cytochrome/quinol oxidase subunit 2